MKSFYLSILLLVIGHSLYGQVVTRHTTSEDLLPNGRFKTVKESPAPLILPEVDVTKLLEEDAREAGQNVPPRFGKAISISADLVSAGKWEDVADGRVWKFSIKSPKAFSLNFFLDKFFLPPGAQLYLYSGDRSIIMGPITEAQNTALMGYATDLIKGDLVTFELFEPAVVTGKSQLHLARVVHGYKNLFGSSKQTIGARYNESLSCEVDINCSAGNAWQTESNSVAMVLLNNGTRLCSGSMLNNACQNLTPNFLTAFHCVDTDKSGFISSGEQNDAQQWVFRFQYKSTGCGGGEGSSYTSFAGAQLLASYNPTDMALLRLNQTPTAANNITYAGWNRLSTPATSSAAIHHPKGDVMKIALSNTNTQAVSWPGSFNTHWRTTFNAGTVEPGSSGSPLFDQNHLIVGQLHGVQNSTGDFCNDRSYDYGRFDLSWNGGGTPQTRLSDWLTDDPSVTQVNTLQRPGLTISGPAHWLICSGGSRTISLTNVPVNSTVTWSAGPGLMPSSGTGPTATVTGNSGSGNTSITFSINPSGVTCGNPLQISQVLYLNAPTLEISPSPYMNICAGRSTTVTLYSGATMPFGDGYFGDPGRSLRWEPAQYLSYGQGTGAATFTRPSNSSPFIISLYMTNTCGTTRQDFYYGTNYNCGYYARTLEVYPNPTAEEVTIANKPDPENSVTPTEPIEAKLYNHDSKLVKAGRAENGKLTLRTKDIPEGLYFLHITQGRETTRQQLMVKH